MYSHKTISTKTRNIFIPSKSLPLPFDNLFSCLSLSCPSQGNNCLSFYHCDLHFLGFYLNGIRQYIIFCQVFFFSLSIIILRLVLIACINSFFPFIVFYCMDVLQFIHSCVSGHSDCFQFLAITDKAAVNLHE